MDKEILLDALNDLDPELVEEGAAPRRRPGRRALILAAALAAAVCIMGATGVLERALLMTGVDIVRTPHRAWVSFRFAEAPYTVEGERALMVGGAPGALGWAEVWAGREAVEVAFQAGGGSGVLNLDAQRLRERIWRELLGDVSWLSAGLDAIQDELEALLPEP